MEIVRASDEQREQVVRDLTRHCGDGRLTLDELEERIAEAYAATTSAELDRALRDLPKQPAPMTIAQIDRAVTPPDLPERRPAPTPATKNAGAVALRVHMVVYVSVIGFLVAIWFLTSPFGYFWPIWPALGWGLALAIHAGIEKTKGDC